jgi:hypothetical protein
MIPLLLFRPISLNQTLLLSIPAQRLLRLIRMLASPSLLPSGSNEDSDGKPSLSEQGLFAWRSLFRSFRLIDEFFVGNDGIVDQMQRIPVSLRSKLGVTPEELPGMVASAGSASI